MHGHSSPHPKGIELHGGVLVLYGCGDFLNDYEGIGGNAAFRGDLSLMFFVTLDPADTRWLQEVLDREERRIGTGVSPAEYGSRLLSW